MKNLDKALTRYYSEQKLDTARLESILLESRSRRWYRSPSLALAAMLAFVAVTLGLLLHLPGDAHEIMLREASLNHRSKLEMEFDDRDVPALRGQMDRLAFNLDLPETLSSGFGVSGARYCTLAGSLAAHVRLVANGASTVAAEEQQDSLSLFMTDAESVTPTLARLASASQGIKPVMQDGVAVSAWEENGLFYVLAGDTTALTQDILNLQDGIGTANQ